MLAKVFAFDPKGINIPRGLVVLAILFVPLAILNYLDLTEFWLSFAFGSLGP